MLKGLLYFCIFCWCVIVSTTTFLSFSSCSFFNLVSLIFFMFLFLCFFVLIMLSFCWVSVFHLFCHRAAFCPFLVNWNWDLYSYQLWELRYEWQTWKKKGTKRLKIPSKQLIFWKPSLRVCLSIGTELLKTLWKQGFQQYWVSCESTKTHNKGFEGNSVLWTRTTMTKKKPKPHTLTSPSSQRIWRLISEGF